MSLHKDCDAEPRMQCGYPEPDSPAVILLWCAEEHLEKSLKDGLTPGEALSLLYDAVSIAVEKDP